MLLCLDVAQMTHINLPIHPIADANFDIGALAGVLAGSDCDIQSTFFNEFATQLKRLCDINKGSLGVSMQCLYISQKLNSETKWILKDIGAD